MCLDYLHAPEIVLLGLMNSPRAKPVLWFSLETYIIFALPISVTKSSYPVEPFFHYLVFFSPSLCGREDDVFVCKRNS